MKWVMVMVFNATFNNISVILWRSVLLLEIEVPSEIHQSAASYWQTLSHNVASSTPRHERMILARKENKGNAKRGVSPRLKI
jgi:hypothetical protein